MVRWTYRFENLAIALIASIAFWWNPELWLKIALFLLLPDLSLLGYLVNKKLGSILYNSVHNYALGLFLIFFSTIIPNVNIVETLQLMGWVLIMHVGIDRFFGFGLKYADSFKKTHIQKL